MIGIVESLKREVRRVYSPRWAFLFVGCMGMGLLGLLAREPSMAIAGMVAATMIAQLARKADHRWRDASRGAE